MMRIYAALAAFLAACCGLGSQAYADTYRLDYEASVLGVVVLGTARYEVTADPSSYSVRANLRTSGLARLFDQTDISAVSTGTLVGADGVSWSRYNLSHSYSGKFRRTQLTRSSSGVATEITPNYSSLGMPPANAAQQRGSFDPLSAVFALGRRIGAARACTGSALVFDGRQHYRLSVSPISQGDFNGGGYQGPALTCSLRYERIAGFSADDNGRIPPVQAQFGLPAQGGFAPLLRLTVPTPVGNGVLDIRHYERVAAAR